MAPIKSTLLALTTLLTTALSLPVIPRALGDGQNFTIFALSSNSAINHLVFGVFAPTEATALPGAYLYDHGSIPLNYGSAYNLGANQDPTILSAAYDPASQVELSPNGSFSVGPGTPGFYIPEGTTLLAFDSLAFNHGSPYTQDTYAACPYTGVRPNGADARYTVTAVVKPDDTAPEGCELINLEVDG